MNNTELNQLPVGSRPNARKFTDSELIAQLDTGSNFTQIADHFNVAPSTISRRVHKLTQRGYDPKTNHTHIVPDGFKLKGTSTLYGEDGKVRMQWVKSTIDDERRQVIMEETLSAISKEIIPVSPRAAGGDYNKDIMVNYVFGDPHVGMYAWAQECGHSWDLVIAEGVHRQVVGDLVHRAPVAEHAMIVNLGDMLHYDSMDAKTARSGNILDADGRYAKIIGVAIDIMLVMIETALAKHKYVHVVNVIGNHDETGALWLAQAIKLKYSDEPRVNVDVSPSVFNYKRFGNNIIGMHHGHTVRQIKNLAGVMATDRARDWGECDHRYWYTGHVHHQQQIEVPGCVIETFGTLATADAYATNGGWRSKQAANAVIMHIKAGEIGRLRSNPEIANVQLGVGG